MSTLHPIFARIFETFGIKEARPKIVTHYLYPPIPMRDYDWCAYREGEEERMQYGYGETEAQAVAELLQLEEEGFYT